MHRICHRIFPPKNILLPSSLRLLSSRSNTSIQPISLAAAKYGDCYNKNISVYKIDGEQLRKGNHLTIKQMVKEGRAIDAYNMFIIENQSLQHKTAEPTVSLQSMSILLRGLIAEGHQWAVCGKLMNQILELRDGMITQRCGVDDSSGKKDEQVGGMASGTFLLNTFRKLLDDMSSVLVESDPVYDEKVVEDVVGAYIRILSMKDASNSLLIQASHLLGHIAKWLISLHKLGHLSTHLLDTFSKDIFQCLDANHLHQFSPSDRYENLCIATLLTSAFKSGVEATALDVLIRLQPSTEASAATINILIELIRKERLETARHILQKQRIVIPASNASATLKMYTLGISCCLRIAERRMSASNDAKDTSVSYDPWTDMNWFVEDAVKKGIHVTALANVLRTQLTPAEMHQVYSKSLHEFMDPNAGYIVQDQFPSLSTFAWRIKDYISKEEIRKLLLPMWSFLDRRLPSRGIEGLLLLLMVKQVEEHMSVSDLCHSFDALSDELHFDGNQRQWAFGLLLRAFLCEHPSTKEISDMMHEIRTRFEKQKEIISILPPIQRDGVDNSSPSQKIEAMLSTISYIGVMPSSQRSIAELHKSLLFHVAKERNTKHLYEILKGLQQQNIMIEGSMANSILSGFAESGHLQQLIQFKSILESQYGMDPLDIHCYGVIVRAFMLAGEITSAREVLNDMHKRGLHMDITMINSIIHGLCKHGREKKALAILKSMTESSIVPDVISFHPIVHAYIHKGQFKEAFEVIDWMTEADIKINQYFVVSLMNGLAQSSGFSHVISFIDSLELHNNSELQKASVLNAALRAFAKQKDTNAFKAIMQKMHDAKMEPDQHFQME